MSASTTRICVKKWLKCENGTTAEEEMRVGNRFADKQRIWGSAGDWKWEDQKFTFERDPNHFS